MKIPGPQVVKHTSSKYDTLVQPPELKENYPMKYTKNNIKIKQKNEKNRRSIQEVKFH
jgi:hypothetical protein